MRIMEEAQAMISDHHQKRNKMMKINKGKRTKRQRPMSSFNLTPNTSSSSSACGEDYANSSFTSASYESTEEDEDMANCLILLAQGGSNLDVSPNQQQPSPVIKDSFFDVYECRTCNRTFPSFQALGGHRASHKKPKTADHDKKPPPPPTTHLANNSTLSAASSMDQQKSDDLESKKLVNKASPASPPPLAQPLIASHMKGFQINKAKMHECSICGSEFSSGQALGGHMRRHRSIVANNNNSNNIPSSTTDNNNNMRVMIKQERGNNILALDLNLPAPEDHEHHHHYQLQHQIHFQRDSNFQFLPTQQTSSLVFNAPGMVDCHY